MGNKLSDNKDTATLEAAKIPYALAPGSFPYPEPVFLNPNSGIMSGAKDQLTEHFGFLAGINPHRVAFLHVASCNGFFGVKSRLTFFERFGRNCYMSIDLHSFKVPETWKTGSGCTIGLRTAICSPDWCLGSMSSGISKPNLEDKSGYSQTLFL